MSRKTPNKNLKNNSNYKRYKAENENNFSDISNEISCEDSLNDFIDDESQKPKRNLEEYCLTLSKLSHEHQKEFMEICNDMNEELPNIEKIVKSNLTKSDKKMCVRLFQQFEGSEPYSSEYYRLIDSINEILVKSRIYTKKEIKFLEEEEEKLRKSYVSADTLKTKILKLEAETDKKAILLRMYEEMLTYPTDSSNYNTLLEVLEWSIRIPYQKREIDPSVFMSNEELNMSYCKNKKKLDEELYGMEKVKNRIIHIFNDRRVSEDACKRNIALVGPPGVGKTAVGKAISKIFGKKFAKISAAGLDSSAIKGSNKVFIGSGPSTILQKLADLKTNNAVIMIDEVDKLDIQCQYALLHVSDTSDNGEFEDNYLRNFSHDLSRVLFIYNLNSVDCINEALRDRFDIIYLDEYTNEEKLQIFKNYMLPKILINLGMGEHDITVNDKAIEKFLKENKLGLRTIENIIKNLVSKVNMYRSVILPNGTLGNLKFDYHIPNFKIPLKVNYDLLIELIK